MTKSTSILFMLSILLACMASSTTNALGGNWFLSLGFLKRKDVEHAVDEQTKLVSHWRNRENKVTQEMDDTEKKSRKADGDEPSVKKASVQKPLAFTRRDPNAMHRGSY